MPRVSEAHLEQRRRQVLDAALRCFARDGFHATSMQDVVAESKLSAGAVYRYFPSKAELVLAAVSGVMARNRAVLTELVERAEVPSPAEALRTVLDRILRAAASEGYDLTRVAVSAWAEALRDPEMAALAEQIYRQMRGDFTRLARRWQEAGLLAPGLCPETAGQLMLSSLLGFVLQRLVLGDVEAESYASGMAALAAAAPPTTPGATEPLAGIPRKDPV